MVAYYGLAQKSSLFINIHRGPLLYQSPLQLKCNVLGVSFSLDSLDGLEVGAAGLCCHTGYSAGFGILVSWTLRDGLDVGPTHARMLRDCGSNSQPRLASSFFFI
jgi:hypothetical protein